MNKNMTKFLLLVIILLFTLGVTSATDNTTHTKDTTGTALEKTTPTVEKVMTKTETTQKETNKTINKKENKNNLKKESQTIILNSKNFDEYVTIGRFNEKVNAGDTIDIQGTIEQPGTTLTVNKPLNFITSTNDGTFSFNRGIFTTNALSNGTNITGITFNNTRLNIAQTSNIKVDNVTTLNVNSNIGAGVGSVCIRESAINITIRNSYFLSKDNGGHSNVVFAAAQNCLFENNIVESFGNVGNVLYITTYNIPRDFYKPNVNITIRNNTIRSPVASVICWGLVLNGYNHIIENNYIEKAGTAVSSQWSDPDWDDPETSVITETGDVIFRNNTISNGSAGLNFKGQVYDNDFSKANVALISVTAYNNIIGNVDIGDNVTFEENNTVINQLFVSGSNSSIKNIGTIKNFGISGSNNTISNINVTSDNMINITGSNNNISNIKIYTTQGLNLTNSNNILDNMTLNSALEFNIKGSNNIVNNSIINTSSTFAIISTGTSNVITNNHITSGTLQGDAAVKAPTNNILQNNTPESSNKVQITEENYSEYFDEEGNSIAIPDNSIISLSGTFNNKDFIFNNLDGLVTSTGVTFYNTTITLKNNTRLSFDDSFTINNTYFEKKTALIIESDNNEFRNQIIIYDDNRKNDFVTIKVTGNNNTILYSVTMNNATSNEDVNGTSLLVEGENNIINGYWYNNRGFGNYTGIIFSQNSKNNKFTGTPLSVTRINATAIVCAIISGNGNKLDNINTYTVDSEDAYSLILNNANNTEINNLGITSKKVTLLLNNSNNNIIENATRIISTTEQYPIKLINSDNNIIRNNYIQNNQTYGGDTAVYQDENSQNNTILRNTNTPVDLSDETYNQLFENNKLQYGNIINIVGDLHDKEMIFDYPVTINANNHILYNSPITVNGASSSINNLIMNASNIPTVLTVNGNLTTLKNVKINATEVPTIININNGTTINTLELYHKNNEIITKTIIITNATLQANDVNMNVLGPAIDVEEYDYELEDYEKDISTIVIYQNGISYFKSNNFNLNLTSTKEGTGKIAALRNEKDTGNSNYYSEIKNAKINITSENDVIGIIGSYGIGSSSEINITGNNVYGVIFNQVYNPAIDGNKFNINAKNNAIVITINKTETPAGLEYNNVNNNEIIVNSGNKATGILLQNMYLVLQRNKITINAPEITGIYTNNVYYLIRSNTLNLNGDNITGIKVTKSTYPPRVTAPVEITSNGIYINTTTGNTLELNNVTNGIIKSNIIEINTTTKSILIENSKNINVTFNTIPHETFPGNIAVQQENNENVIVLDNTPESILILTDENYENYFTEGEYTAPEYQTIHLGSNLYNKNLIFKSRIKFYGDEYTIYNGTIEVQGVTSITQGGITYKFSIQNVTIDNTGVPKQAIISNSPLDFSNNNLINASILIENSTTLSTINYTNVFNTNGNVFTVKNALVFILYNNIIYDGDNQELIILEKYTQRNGILIQYNKIIVKGDNNTIFHTNNVRLGNTYYNEITAEGNNNTAICIGNMTSATASVTYNNITIKSSMASTPVLIDTARVYFNTNQILSNTTQGEKPLVKVITTTNGQVNNNYIESIDLVGNDAVSTPGTKSGNTPTTSGYKAMMNIETSEFMVYTLNEINVTVTDLFNNTITGTITATVDGENVEVVDNKILYYTTTPGTKNMVVTYTDPEGKYSTLTQTQQITVIVPESETELSSPEVTLGEKTNISATFYTDDGNQVTSGKAIFRVNGKTLRDDEGNVIYVDVVDGKAVLPDVNITNEWMKPDTTLQAIYTGDNNEAIITKPTTINVTRPEATVTLEAPATATAGETITLKATVTDGNTAISSGRVAFKLNGKTLKDPKTGKALYANVENGVATIQYTIPEKTKAKEYTLTAVFTDTNYDRVEAESKLNVVKA